MRGCQVSDFSERARDAAEQADKQKERDQNEEKRRAADERNQRIAIFRSCIQKWPDAMAISAPKDLHLKFNIHTWTRVRYYPHEQGYEPEPGAPTINAAWRHDGYLLWAFIRYPSGEITTMEERFKVRILGDDQEWHPANTLAEVGYAITASAGVKTISVSSREIPRCVRQLLPKASKE
jgi:hypothetical protein